MSGKVNDSTHSPHHCMQRPQSEKASSVALPAECLICQESNRTQQSANWMLREAVIPRGASSGHTAPALH